MNKDKRIRIILICILTAGITLILLGVFLSGKGKSTGKEIEEREEREREISAFLEKSAAIDNVTVKLCYSDEGKVTGAAVVCSRGNDARVQKEVVGLLTVLLDVGAHEVYVSGN